MKDKTILILISVVLLVVLGLGIYGIMKQNNSPSSNSGVNDLSQNQTSTPVINISTTTPNSSTTNLLKTNPIMKHIVTIKTNYGTIEFGTYDNDAPKTVSNFIQSVQKGLYNGLIFHRVINGFMIQGGDPYCSSKSGADTGVCGTGSLIAKFNDELNPNTPSYQQGYQRGVVAMANSGPNTNGSQFFIMQSDNSLPHNYTIFGKVISGMDVVDKIALVKTDSNDRPISPVIMENVSVSQK